MLPSNFLNEVNNLLTRETARVSKARAITEAIRKNGNYRWTGLYDVDVQRGLVSNIAWSGPAPPEYPVFPMTKGLTSRAIAGKTTVNVGDVSKDSDYLTALSTTQSEIIVPILGNDGRVTGTLDVESEHRNAFNAEIQSQLEECAVLLKKLWN